MPTSRWPNKLSRGPSSVILSKEITTKLYNFKDGERILDICELFEIIWPVLLVRIKLSPTNSTRRLMKNFGGFVDPKNR